MLSSHVGDRKLRHFFGKPNGEMKFLECKTEEYYYEDEQKHWTTKESLGCKECEAGKWRKCVAKENDTRNIQLGRN